VLSVCDSRSFSCCRLAILTRCNVGLQVRTLLDAAEVEDEVLCGAGAPDITFEEILGSMDEECGARVGLRA